MPAPRSPSFGNETAACAPFAEERHKAPSPFTAARKADGEKRHSELIDAGKATPVIDRTYPLREIPDAIRHLEAGHARGKAVITV